MLGTLLQKVAGQGKYVFTPLTQSRQAQANHIQAVVQVLAEHAFLDALLQVLVGGSNHARVGLDGVVSTHAVEMPVAQHAQQTRLQVKRHVANFIEKQRASLGLLKTATAHGLRAGKRAALMAKQFAFQQVFWNGSGVDGDKRAVGTT